MSKQIETLLSSISEELLFEAYQKIASIDDRLPRKVKNENSFYLTIFYKELIIRSRTVSCKEKENNLEKPDLKEAHKKIASKLFFGSEKHNDCDSCVEESTFAFRIGYTVFVTTNHSLKASEILTYILVGTFVLMKSILLIKEWGNLYQLLSYARKQDSIAKGYLNNIQEIAFGSLGNHR